MSLPVEAGRSELDRSFGFVPRSNCRDRRRRMLMNTNDHEDIGNVISGQVPRAGRREWIGLAVIALPCLLYSMDLEVLYLAIPSLTADLEPTSSQLLWITDIYGVLLVGLGVLAGRAGDDASAGAGTCAAAGVPRSRGGPAGPGQCGYVAGHRAGGGLRPQADRPGRHR